MTDTAETMLDPDNILDLAQSARLDILRDADDPELKLKALKQLSDTATHQKRLDVDKGISDTNARFLDLLRGNAMKIVAEKPEISEVGRMPTVDATALDQIVLLPGEMAGGADGTTYEDITEFGQQIARDRASRRDS